MFISGPGISYLHWRCLCVYTYCKAKILFLSWWASEAFEMNDMWQMLNRWSGVPEINPCGQWVCTDRAGSSIYHMPEWKTGSRWWSHILKIYFRDIWKGIQNNPRRSFVNQINISLLSTTLKITSWVCESLFCKQVLSYHFKHCWWGRRVGRRDS